MKFLTFPPFRVQAMVRIWIYDADAPGSGFHHHPSAVINVECYARHTGELDALRWAAERVLLSFGASPEILKAAYFDWTVTKYIATEPRGVRLKPTESIWNREPVEAFTEYQLDRDDKKAARIKTLVRQRRFVPDNALEMRRLYDPAPVATPANQAVPA